MRFTDINSRLTCIGIFASIMKSSIMKSPVKYKNTLLRYLLIPEKSAVNIATCTARHAKEKHPSRGATRVFQGEYKINKGLLIL